MKIGLLGGSFDPAHAGHAHVAETALKRLGLDKVWWLVSPQNPLKPQSSPLAQRVASARLMARGRKMLVTDIEARLGGFYAYQTVRALKRLYPGVRFTFLIGEDNLANFRRWRNWRELAGSVAFAVIARPGVGLRQMHEMPKHWRFLNARHCGQSSTALRARRRTMVAKPGRK